MRRVPASTDSSVALVRATFVDSSAEASTQHVPSKWSGPSLVSIQTLSGAPAHAWRGSTDSSPASTCGVHATPSQCKTTPQAPIAQVSFELVPVSAYMGRDVGLGADDQLDSSQ